MHDRTEDVAPRVFPLFTQPAAVGELVPRERAAPPPVSRTARPPAPVDQDVAEHSATFHEQVAARRLCGQLRSSDRCPGECVTTQLARGVPLRELRGLDAFREVREGRPR